jgi:hypothetical protein
MHKLSQLTSTLIITSAALALMPTVAIADISGFGDFSAFTLNQNDGAAAPTLSPGTIRLTNQSLVEARSIFANVPQDISQFSASFTYQVLNGLSNQYGACFVIQNNAASVNAIGSSQSGLGYHGINQSIAISLELLSPTSSGLYSGGTVGGGASSLSPSGIDLLSGHMFKVDLSYNGSLLKQTITDETTSAAFNTSYLVNIPAAVGSSTAYVGFAASTGFGAGADQYISRFTFTNVPEPSGTALAAIAAGTLAIWRRKRRCTA